MWLCINCKKNLWRETRKKNSTFVWSVDLFKPSSELGPRSRPGLNHWKVSKCKGTRNSRITDPAWIGILHLSAWPNNLHRSKSKILVSS